jgi:hypothetical protein
MRDQSILEKSKTACKSNGILKISKDNLKSDTPHVNFGEQAESKFFYLCEQDKSACTV